MKRSKRYWILRVLLSAQIVLVGVFAINMILRWHDGTLCGAHMINFVLLFMIILVNFRQFDEQLKLRDKKNRRLQT